MAGRRTFGTTRKLPSGRWQASYWYEGMRHTAPSTFTAKADANAYLANVETDLGRGEWIDPNAGKVTFRQYAERWRANQIHHRGGTVSQIETNLRRHVYPYFGDRPMQAIRPSDIQAWVKVLSEGNQSRKALAPATIEVVFAWVSSIFKAAQGDRIIARSPCQKTKRPIVTRERVEPLTTKTVKALIDSAPEQYRAMIVLGAGTGVRISEALGLTTDRVLWLDRRVKIDRQLAGVGEDGEPVFGPVKDRQNRPRTIPLPDVVIDELSAHVARQGLGDGGLLFTGPNGGPVRTSTFSELWRKLADPLGIPSGVGFHALRHYYASLLIREGESVKTVQDRLGHTSATMTLDVYGHLWPEDEDRTRTAIDNVLGREIAHVARTLTG